MALILRTRGDLFSFQGELLAALEDFVKAHRLLEQAGEDQFAEGMLSELGIVYRRLGDFDQAERYLSMSLEVADRTGDTTRQIHGRVQMGFVHFERGNSELAFESFTAAEKVAEDASYRPLLGAAIVGKTFPLNMMERFDESLAELERAETIFREEDFRLSDMLVKLQRGIALAGLGRHDDALEKFAQVEPELIAGQQHRYLVLLYLARSSSLEAIGGASSFTCPNNCVWPSIKGGSWR